MDLRSPAIYQQHPDFQWTTSTYARTGASHMTTGWLCQSGFSPVDNRTHVQNWLTRNLTRPNSTVFSKLAVYHQRAAGMISHPNMAGTAWPSICTDAHCHTTSRRCSSSLLQICSRTASFIKGYISTNNVAVSSLMMHAGGNVVGF